MKIIYILLIIVSALCSQDSLYWFNFNKLKKNKPKTPRVLDKIFEESLLDDFNLLKNNINGSLNGYRLQIYDDLSVESINEVFNKYKNKLSDSIYIVFEAPFYKIHYGNYISKKEAEIQKNYLINKGFENIWIVRSRINQ